jgi:uncharacterized membrane protein YozB (DUF420 family)
MAGLFGTNVLLSIDLNLILQIVTIIIIGVAFYYKTAKNYRMHGTIMAVAVILHIISFIEVMGPRFRENLDIFTTATFEPSIQTAWIHIIPGAIALVLGIVLVAAWAFRQELAGCFRRKRIMDVTIVLWLFSLIFGIATYLLTYL